jgi:transposase
MFDDVEAEKGRVAQVLERELHVCINPLHLWRVLRDMGWSYTGRRARENQET